MSFSEWRQWYRSLPWSMKWFVILVLFRSIIDIFYSFKTVSPFFSPLYIVGILTPILIIWSFASSNFPPRSSSGNDIIFNIWSIAVITNLVIILLLFPEMDTVGNTIKYISPVLLFFYLRRFIRSKDDLHGILQTFLYSAIFPFCMIAYEILIEPIQVEELTEQRGGGVRLQGAYADVMNYSFYIIGTFLIASYFFLQKLFYGLTGRFETYKLLLVLFICIIALIAIKHTATWGVFFALCLLLFMYNLSSLRGIVLIAAVLLLISFFGQEIYDKQINPLINKEIKVVEGDRAVEQSFNGRMTRWIKYFTIWDEMPLLANIFGVSFSGEEVMHTMVGGGMHNDFVRIMFLSGVIGLAFYLLYLFSLFYKRKWLNIPQKFLFMGSIVSLILYSISSIPTLYMPYLYLIFSIFAYVSLPSQILKNDW